LEKCLQEEGRVLYAVLMQGFVFLSWRNKTNEKFEVFSGMLYCFKTYEKTWSYWGNTSYILISFEDPSLLGVTVCHGVNISWYFESP